MDDSTKSSPCKECENGVEGALGAEVEHLRQHLAERDSHIVALEGEFIKCTSHVNELEDQLSTWREKYERLYDSHKRVQKLNQVLEDKLLQMVDKMKGEKSQLTKDIATLSVRLAESKHNYSMLQKENERYKNDMNLAIQLLQCKPDNFVSQKLDNLPVDTQARVSQYVMSKTSKPSSTTQSKNGNGNSNDIDTFDASEYEFNISASLMSKILEDSIQDTVTKHCDTCTCNKTQNKPFCYNESYYSIATQTFLSGEMKSSPCINCNAEIKSLDSNLSIGSVSTHGIRLINERSPNHVVGPLYILPQPAIETHKEKLVHVENSIASNVTVKEEVIIEELPKIDVDANKNEIAQKIDDLKHIKRHNGMSMEPSVHHKLCDRTRTPLSSKKSSGLSVDNEDLLNAKEVTVVPVPKEIIPIPKSIEKSADNVSMRKNSLGSMGAVSRTSSVAKSTVSTHKSNTAVGPGPRFCHLRMQAGSKNILLDNAEPDVPPILYRRQSKCNENSLFKELNDDVDNVLDLNKNEPEHQEEVKTDTIVVESTLIDVHVDNNYKESMVDPNNTSINPVLLNVSSSPLQPLKTHNFSHSSENNNNKSQSVGSHHNTSEVDNLLSDFNADIANVQNNNDISNPPTDNANMTLTVTTPTDDNNVKIFNFDRYEQNKLSSQYNKPLRKIDMSHLHSLENTKISKDLPPQGNMPKLEKMVEAPKSTLPPIVNVYPNLTQTHLKVNDNKKVFTNEQSTSSMSSDDSAALLQKQQLLRVAEWVEKNLEQHNNYDNLDDDVNFSTRLTRKENNISRLTETLNELALNMPHPVSKYSKSYRDAQNTWIHGTQNHLKPNKQNSTTKITNVIKETIFPVESGDAVTEVSNDVAKSVGTSSDHKPDKDTLNAKSDKEITPEDLARMEYNVKKFLLSGPYWVNPGSAGRSRRTSSKTETDV